jgi:predicted TIM-barrel fold metal-dependent hydrolase
MHADMGPGGIRVPPLRHGWTAGPQTPEQHIEGSRERGVEQVLALDPPHVCFELRRIFGDYVVPVPLVDMDKITPQEIDQLLSQGAAGIKFICPLHSYGDNRYRPLYDVIRSRGALAIFHTGYLSDTLLQPGRLLGRADFVDITHMRPAAIDRIARAFPDLKVLMAHFGNPWWEEAWNVIHSFKNVYADFSGGTAYRKPIEMWKQLFTFGGRSDLDSIGRMCFATDASCCFQNLYQFQPFIEFYERFFDALDVPADLREQVNRGNAKRLIARTA